VTDTDLLSICPNHWCPSHTIWYFGLLMPAVIGGDHGEAESIGLTGGNRFPSGILIRSGPKFAAFPPLPQTPLSRTSSAYDQVMVPGMVSLTTRVRLSVRPNHWYPSQTIWYPGWEVPTVDGAVMVNANS
jgi:hypothetical protein